MGFMDKVKSQAGALAEKAQEGAKAGQGKLSQFQGKRQSDALLLELGGIVYVEHAGRPEPGGQARKDEIMSELASFEAMHGAITVTSAVAQAGVTGTFIPGGTGPGGPAPAGTSAGTFVPGADPTGGGIPTSSPGIPTSSPGIPTSSPGGGIPSASYSSDDEAPAD